MDEWGDALRNDDPARHPLAVRGRWEAQAHTLLASIVQSSHDAIVAMTLDRQVLSWNPGAERLFGYTADEMLGQNIDRLVPPNLRDDAMRIVDRVASGGRADRFRTRRYRSDGSLVTISLTVSPLTDPDGRIVGVASMARDISDRERSEARLGAVLDAAPDAILAVAPDNRVILANGQAERLFDWDVGAIVGADVGTLLPDGLPAESERTSHRPDDEAFVSTALRRDGGRVPVEITVSSADTDEGPVRCAVVRDVTERLQAQKEQERLREEAERGRNEARLQRTQRLESLGQLAGGIAHDFNNLVGVILSYAEFIIEEAQYDGDLETIGVDARQILRAAQRGSELTHQLLSFARREVIRAQVLDINQVVMDVEQLLHRALGEHIDLSTCLAPDLPAVTADPGQLEQVLVNLAVNSRDAMPSGGQLTVETATQEVDEEYAATRPALRPQTYIRLRISDTGTGMSRETADRAFEPFFTTKPSGEGTGLGLATVYGIVTQAGGDVQIYSERGMGTTINILLPATGGRPSGAVDGRDLPVERGRGETILVAEDETALREVVVRILTSAGYSVLPADGGPTALALSAEHSGPVHLLLTDVVMPGMLGKELAVRLTGSRPEARVLFVSGYARPVLAANGTLEPDVALLEKPFSRAELLTAVRQRLDG